MDGNFGQFKQLNDFIIDDSAKRVRVAGISGTIFQPSGHDPIEFLALSNDDGVMPIYGLLNELRNDLYEIRSLEREFYGEERYDKFRFELYILTTINLINAILFQLKLLIEAKPDWEKLISQSELNKYRDNRLSFINKTKLILQLFSKVHGLNVTLDVHGEGWKSYRKTVNIRHKFAHPSSIDDMSVNFEQTVVYIVGWSWFCEYFVKIMKEYKKAISTSENNDHPSEVGIFHEDGLYGMTSSMFRERDVEDCKKKREVATLSILGAPKELRKALLTASMASFSVEDCRYLKTENIVFKIRMIVITTFLSIECLISQTRQLAEDHLIKSKQKNINLLKSELGSGGTFKDIANELKYLCFEEKIHVIANTFAILHGLDWRFDFPSDPTLLQKFISVRDGLTHPKSAEDVRIGMREFKVIKDAESHINHQYMKMFKLYSL